MILLAKGQPNPAALSLTLQVLRNPCSCSSVAGTLYLQVHRCIWNTGSLENLGSSTNALTYFITMHRLKLWQIIFLIIIQN